MGRSVVSRSSFFARRQRQRVCFSTYYDSQSGLHLPVHNEKEITLILNKSKEDAVESFVPGQLYKEDYSDMPDKLQALSAQGIHGIILPPSNFPRDLRNLNTLNNIAPPSFYIFASLASPPTSSRSWSNTSMVVEFAPEDAALQDVMRQHVDNGQHTMLSIGEHVFNNAQQAVTVASQVANLIDQTKGGDFFWLSSSSGAVDADDVVELCEELMYLDVAGPTIKSRLVIDSGLNEEVIEETMMAGVNKYIIDDEQHVSVLEEIAKRQGKSILVRSQ